MLPFKLPFSLPRPVWYALGALVALLLLWWALDSYGDRRYDQGKADTDKAWQEASDRLIAKAQNSSREADKAVAAQVAQHAVKVEEEKEKIDEAIARGDSPLDVLFGS